MLNPPMALFEKHELACYQIKPPLNKPLVYPDFLNERPNIGAGGINGAGYVPELVHISPPQIRKKA